MRLNYRQRLGMGVSTALYLNLFSGCGIHRTSPFSVTTTLKLDCDFENSGINQYINCLNKSVPRDVVNSVVYNHELNEIAEIRPLTDYDSMGKKVKRDIVLGRRFFQDLKTNAEANGVIIHELRHQFDYFYSIELNGITLPFSVPSRELTVEFVKALDEVRGYYEELQFLIGAARTGDVIRSQHLCTVITRYVLYNYMLNQLPRNDIQRKIANAQLSLITDSEWKANFIETGVKPKVNQIEIVFERQYRYRCEWSEPVGI